MQSRKMIGSLLIGMLILSLGNIAAAAEYIPFRERHPRLVVPKYEEPKVLMALTGPKLIFSDSPEMVRDCGVTYRDTVSGKIRLFFHHVNATNSDKRLAVVLRNRSLRPAQVTLGARGISKPREEENWLLAGKEAQKEYFKDSHKGETFKLVRYKELLTGNMGKRIKPNELITGIVDLEVSKPVEVSFILLPVHTDFNAALEMYKPLPADKGGHVLRGTFPFADLQVTLPQPFDTEGRTVQGIVLADNVKDPYVQGVDALTGKKVINYGNYGVVYTFDFPTKGQGQTAVNFSPEGGSYAGYGKFGTEDSLKNVAVPGHKTAFGFGGADEAITLGKIAGGRTGKFVFSPPGSSNLPIKVVLIPEKKLEKKS